MSRAVERRSLFLAATLPALIALAACASGRSAAGGAQASTGPTEVGQGDARSKPAAREARAGDDATEAPEVSILLDEMRFVIDRDGRVTSTWHCVFRVETEDGVKGWSMLHADWKPWQEAKPELRAKVTLPDGRVLELDPKTIDDAPVESDDGEVLSDQRAVRAPLPGLAVGAIVDEEVVQREVQPFFEGGGAGGFGLAWDVPVAKSRLVVEVPDGAPFQWAIRGERTVQLTEERAGDTRRLTFEGGPFEPWGRPELNSPAYFVGSPRISFSTSTSWADLAHRYAAVVERQLAGAKLDELLEKVPGDPKADRRAVIAAALAAVHARVRYTGVELGEAAVVPRSPTETLQRGFGDCKDKSTLLVALLRAKGIDAHVALLQASFGSDVQEKVPSLGVFNHAIVHVPGSPELWIDATAEDAQPGELSLEVEGRLALIADRATEGLRRIPEVSSADNVYHELREVTLAEQGAAQVLETSWSTGTLAASLRAMSKRPTKDVREELEKYVKDTYRARALGTVGWSHDVERAGDLRLRVEAEGATRGFSEQNEAYYAVSLRPLFVEIPGYFAADEGEPKKKREQPFTWYQPYSVQAEYRIRPPLGFVVRALPEPRAEVMGGARMEVRWAAEPDGSVTARLAFDTGKRTWTAEEYEGFRASYAKLMGENMTLVYFDHAGAKAIAAGQVKEGLRIYRELLEKAPRDPIHHTRLAGAYLRAGFGQAARAEAEKAVNLAPASAAAHFQLGYVLAHDRFGRELEPVMDRGASREAYRRAKTLDPKLSGNRRNLALALEYAPDGTHWGKGAKLDEAIEEYKAIKKELDRDDWDANLMEALLRAGRYPELRTFAKENAKTDEGLGMLLAAMALSDGTAALRGRLDELASGAERKARVMELAFGHVLEVRNYPLAAELLGQIAAESKEKLRYESFVRVLKRTERREDVVARARGPGGTVLAFFADAAGGASSEVYGRWLAKGLRTKARDDDEVAGLEVFVRAMRGQLRGSGGKSGLSEDLLVDLMVSIMEPRIDGDDATGYRVKMRSDFAATPTSVVMYVVKEGGSLVIAAAPFLPGALGREALARIERGDLKGAKRWLDWAYEDVRDRDGDAPRGPGYTTLWGPSAPQDKEVMRVAAASLAASEKPVDARTIAILAEAAAKAEAGERRDVLRRSLARAYDLVGDDARLVTVARALHEAKPDAPDLRAMYVEALVRTNAVAEARRLLEATIGRDPSDSGAAAQLANLHASKLGEPAKARDILEKALDRGQTSPAIYNNLAWVELFLDGAREQAIDHALKAATATQYSNAAYLHTLAVAYAEAGQVSQAMEALKRLMELHGGEPSGDDWYVYGRIAEEFELPAVAREAYARVRPPKRDAKDSTWALAERRRKGLERGAGR